jgi:glycosyltransferase involved in cell wall biosynthesis
MKKITFIISALNEGKHVIDTLKSLFASGNHELFDVIVIDDGSEKWEPIPKKYPVVLITHEQRKGVQASRDEGVSIAQTPYVCVLNARMRFIPGWIEKSIEYLDRESKTLFCTTSVVLWDKSIKEVEDEIKKLKSLPKVDEAEIKAWEDYKEKIKDLGPVDEIDDKKERKYGAKILESYKYPNYDLILAANWQAEQSGNSYEIPCVLGACYMTSKAWWQYIRGLEGLYSYGSDEELLSLKTWAFGGKVKIIKEIETGNLYREIKSYCDPVEDLMWNKMFIAFTLLNWHRAINILSLFNQSAQYEKHYTIIMKRLIIQMPYIIAKRNEYEKLKIHDIENLVTKMEDK